MKTSRLWQKVIASAINCAAVLALTLPFVAFLGVELWKIITISSFFCYNVICRKRCLGMRFVGTFIEPPTTVLYALTYTTGFATIFYSVALPGDLLALNGFLQTVSYMTTGNTAHGWVAGQATMTRDQYMELCKSRARLALLEGKPDKAVHDLIADLGKYKETAPPHYIAQLGLVLLKEGDEIMIQKWIEGFA